MLTARTSPAPAGHPTRQAEPARPGQAPPSGAARGRDGAARPSGPAAAMGAGGLWVRAAHTALSGGLALGLFLHRTGEAGPPSPSVSPGCGGCLPRGGGGLGAGLGRARL